ncbi:hypothetical protein C1646_726579 [Rhizophagus diaphanus]|nr:hypothetical protein C1646_726579 [Rhizophagus diaphanus] [Rhizophagus sp. MUCL 43196]
MQKQIKGADKSSSSNSKFSTSLGVPYIAHSEAIYTSRLLDYNNLPEPKNSDDYYEDNDNIISVKFSDNSDYSYETSDKMINMNSSESLQIDISQLNIRQDEQNNKPKGKEKI